jgi:hypothetical protein
MEEQVSTSGDHTTGARVLTDTEGMQLPPVAAGSAIQANDDRVLEQRGPAERQLDVGMTVAHGVTPHDVIGPIYRLTTGSQPTPLGLPHEQGEHVAGTALRATPPVTSMLVPMGQVGGTAVPE